MTENYADIFNIIIVSRQLTHNVQQDRQK